MNSLLICSLIAMLLLLFTPVALLLGVDLWRVIVVIVLEVIMLVIIGWLKK